MESIAKDTMLQVVKSWMKNDAEIRILQKEQQQRKMENKTLSTQLMEIMKQHEIDCLEIKDGKILYKKRTVKKAISKKVLFQLLSRYFQGDEQKANSINHFILEHREVAVKETVEFQTHN